jgi:symplekin
MSLLSGFESPTQRPHFSQKTAKLSQLYRMADNPVDPLQALSAALSVQADSKEQADLLAALRESLEAHPSPIPILCTTLLKIVPGAGDSFLKRWVLDLLQFAISRSSLTLDARTQR